MSNASPSQARDRILQLLVAGKHAEATAQAEDLLAAHPEDMDACYAAGVARLSGERAADAIGLLQQVVATRPDDHVAACNLGIACLRSGDPAGAAGVLRPLVRLHPDYKNARYNLACAQIALGDGWSAEKNLSQLLALAPDNPQWLTAMGDAARLQHHWQRATTSYRKAIAAAPGQAAALNNLSHFLLNTGETGEAASLARQLVAVSKQPAEALLHLGNCLTADAQFDEAMHAYADAHALNPDSAPLCAAIGKSWSIQGEHAEAATWLANALRLAPENLDATCALADAARELGNVEQALALLAPLTEKGESSVEYQMSLSSALWDDGDADGARAALDKAISLVPQRAALHARLGTLLESSGDMEGARAAFHKGLELNPNCIPALNGLAIADRGKLDDALVERIRQLLARPSARMTEGKLASLHFALAYVDDGRKQAATAAEHMRTANRLQWSARSKRSWEYDPGEYERHVDRIIATFNRDFIIRHKDMGNPDARPVFIVGMPRSGTTLTEQIMARHSRVLGIGERNFASRAFQAVQTRLPHDQKRLQFPEFMEQVSSAHLMPVAAEYLRTLQALIDKSGKTGVLRVVDKMPDNYSLLGFLTLLFPQARFIHCRRDPRDVAMSCFQTQFGAIRWACDTGHLVERFRQYARLMRHWRDQLPAPILESEYELLTADQETGSRKLIEWLGLEWEDACLSFYESDRLVRTASITQVRQPMYRSSVAKWKAYEKLLPDLLDPLAEVEATLRG